MSEAWEPSLRSRAQSVHTAPYTQCWQQSMRPRPHTIRRTIVAPDLTTCTVCNPPVGCRLVTDRLHRCGQAASRRRVSNRYMAKFYGFVGPDPSAETCTHLLNIENYVIPEEKLKAAGSKVLVKYMCTCAFQNVLLVCPAPVGRAP